MRDAIKLLFNGIKDSTDAQSQYICAFPKTKKVAIKQFLHLCSKAKLKTTLIDNSTVLIVKNNHVIYFDVATELPRRRAV